MAGDQRFFRASSGEVYVTNDDIKGHYYTLGEFGCAEYDGPVSQLTEVFVTDKTPEIPMPEEPVHPGTVARATFANHQDPGKRLIYVMMPDFDALWITMDEESGDTDSGVLFSDFMSDDGEWYPIAFEVLHPGWTGEN